MKSLKALLICAALALPMMTMADDNLTNKQLNEEVIIDTIKGTPPKELKMDDAIIFGVKQLAAEPARTPNGAFSTTMPCHGLLLPVLRSPIRYGSGFGLPRSTS